MRVAASTPRDREVPGRSSIWGRIASLLTSRSDTLHSDPTAAATRNPSGTGTVPMAADVCDRRPREAIQA